jgi:hypothetical protein
MYKRLLWLLVFSIISVLLIFFINGTLLLFFNVRTMQQYYWKYKWISLEGLLHVLYLVVFLGILLLWRPTEHNSRYGLHQISQDEDEALDLEVRLLGRGGRRKNGVLNENDDDNDHERNFIVGFELDEILDVDDNEYN